MSNESFENDQDKINVFQKKDVHYCIDGDYKDFNNFQYNQLKTLLSLKEIDDYPCYFMKYEGEYSFSQFLKVGAKNLKEQFEFLEKNNMYPPILSGNNYNCGCTCFFAKNKEGEYLYGYNHDWEDACALLLYTNPQGAYSSLSMVGLTNFGYTEGVLALSLWEKRHLLSTPYFPIDGMNECGVSISLVKVPFVELPYNVEKVSIMFTAAIRLVLDYAKDVNSAIEILKKFNIASISFEDEKGINNHYLIGDSSGDTAVVEFADGEMKVTRGNTPWQAIANFYMYKYQQQGKIRGAGFERYKCACELLKKYNGIISTEQAFNILNKVKMPTVEELENALDKNTNIHETCWSSLYNLSNGIFSLVLGKKFAERKEFDILTKFHLI